MEGRDKITIICRWKYDLEKCMQEVNLKAVTRNGNSDWIQSKYFIPALKSHHYLLTAKGKTIAQSTPKPRDHHHLHQEGPQHLSDTRRRGASSFRLRRCLTWILSGLGLTRHLIWEASDKMTVLVFVFVFFKCQGQYKERPRSCPRARGPGRQDTRTHGSPRDRTLDAMKGAGTGRGAVD